MTPMLVNNGEMWRMFRTASDGTQAHCRIDNLAPRPGLEPGTCGL